MILKMAFRNLFRHKQRTLLTIITMIVGILLSVVADGTYGGMENQVINTYINTDTGYYKIYPKDYYEDKYDNEPLEHFIPKETEEELDKVLAQKRYTKRLAFNGKIINGADELNALFLASDIHKEINVFHRDRYMVEGSFEHDREHVVLGSELAKILHVKKGDTVTLTARTSRKSIDAYDMTINGIIKTGNPILDAQVIFMPLEFGKIFAETDLVNDIAIGQKLSKEELNYLKKMDIDFIPYEKEMEGYMNLVKADKISFLFIGIGILSMASINIANTMLMAMLEREKEVGVLMANGMKRKNILKLFLAEGTFAGLLGTSIGMLIGGLIVFYYQQVGIPLTNMKDMMGDVPVTDMLFMRISFKSMFGIGAVGFLFSLLAAYYPAHKSTKLNPVEALRRK